MCPQYLQAKTILPRTLSNINKIFKPICHHPNTAKQKSSIHPITHGDCRVFDKLRWEIPSTIIHKPL
jgi:hypothetical protein